MVTKTRAKTVRLPEDLAERLREAAHRDRMSQAAMITEAVEAHLNGLDWDRANAEEKR